MVAAQHGHAHVITHLLDMVSVPGVTLHASEQPAALVLLLDCTILDWPLNTMIGDWHCMMTLHGGDWL